MGPDRCPIIIPWRAGCPHRERNLAWLLDRYTADGWPVVVAELAPDEPWIKACAVNPALRRVPDGPVAVVDADVTGGDLVGGLRAWRDGAPWAIPHTMVHRLTGRATADVIGGVDPVGLPVLEAPYPGTVGGGAVLAGRQLLLDVPLDPRYQGWGQEDASWGVALTTIAGEPWRSPEPLWHLWHPPQPRLTRKIGSHDGKALWRRYQAAARDPAAMSVILEEARQWRSESSSTPAVSANC